jgi:hypothetical protein
MGADHLTVVFFFEVAAQGTATGRFLTFCLSFFRISDGEIGN